MLLDKQLSNDNEKTKLPNPFSGIGEAIEIAYRREIVAVGPNEDNFDDYTGVFCTQDKDSNKIKKNLIQ